jgi:hypothetical protein
LGQLVKGRVGGLASASEVVNFLCKLNSMVKDTVRE